MKVSVGALPFVYDCAKWKDSFAISNWLVKKSIPGGTMMAQKDNKV